MIPINHINKTTGVSLNVLIECIILNSNLL